MAAPAKEIVTVPGLPAGLPFAQCVRSQGFLFVAGQVGVDRDSRLVSAEFAPQAHRALDNLGSALAAGNSTFEDIVEMTVYLADARHGAEFVDIRRRLMGDALAASTMICGVNYILPGALIEIRATAMVTGEDV
jgi:2-iminobutanoate/2-iminopropanoate deaminase